MKKLLLGIMFLCTTLANAQSVCNAKFGMPYEEAVAHIKNVLGTPTTSQADRVVYKNVMFKGIRWSEMIFTFKDGKMTEARCYLNEKSKNAAKAQLHKLAKEMKKEHALSEDYEEDGTVFFAGGKSPVGMGHLFTIFLSPRNGVWTMQMRFGPFAV